MITKELFLLDNVIISHIRQGHRHFLCEVSMAV